MLKHKTIHLVDSTQKVALGTVRQDVKANCGQRLDQAKVRLKNDWAKGECREWLDYENVCDACRGVAMKRTDAQFTYGVA